jgi:hypothetical protein
MMSIVRSSNRPSILPAVIPLAIGPQAHRTVERALENGKPAFGVTPQKKEFARLVGGERQAHLLLGQSARQMR